MSAKTPGVAGDRWKWKVMGLLYLAAAFLSVVEALVFLSRGHVWRGLPFLVYAAILVVTGRVILRDA